MQLVSTADNIIDHQMSGVFGAMKTLQNSQEQDTLTASAGPS
jgi:hypothetical protein